MLLFSTVLNINNNLTKEKFIKLVIRWNQDNPRAYNVIPNIEWHGERHIRYGDESLWMEIEEYRNKNIIAVRYEKRDANGIIWDTDYIMNFTTMKMGITLDRTYTEDAFIYNHEFSTPHFITLLINKHYVALDHDLPVLREPLMINEENLSILASIINGQSKYYLPVVYVSKTYDNENPVDTAWLSSRLKGVAHVLVQEDCKTNAELRRITHSKNEYYGAIGVYFPAHSRSHKRFLNKQDGIDGYNTYMLDNVVRDVIGYCNEQEIDHLLTWHGVRTELLRDRFKAQVEKRLFAESQQAQAEQEVVNVLSSLEEKEKSIREEAQSEAEFEANNILQSFEEEYEQLQKRVDELANENETLHYENQKLKAKLDRRDAIPVLFAGDEYDFYQDEIKDLLLSVLTDALNNLPSDSRRYHIVEDIISHNNYHSYSTSKAKTIKALLKNYKGMDARTRKALEDLGFEITEDGIHYKVRYYGDGRYQTSIGKTPSDSRAGKNNASIIIKMCF